MGIVNERKQAARKAALERIKEQVESGELVIRQMTPAEREKYGPPKNQEAPKKRKRVGALA